MMSALDQLLATRIAILDGAMGTMIQRHQLTEADFRGERFAGHAHELRGNNDLLVLTQPAIIRTIHSDYLAAGADVIGVNCSIGPAHMLDTVERMAAATRARLAAQPGIARTVVVAREAGQEET